MENALWRRMGWMGGGNTETGDSREEVHLRSHGDKGFGYARDGGGSQTPRSCL